MENDNPFQSPQPFTAELVDDLESAKVVCRMFYSEEHLKESLARYRKQKPLYKTRRAIVLIMAAIFGLFAIALWIRGTNVVSATFLSLVTLFFIASNKINDFFAIRSLRKTKLLNLNQTMIFDSNGFASESEHGKSEIKWSLFTRAVFFNDGVMLFQTARQFYWLPQSAFEDPTGMLTLRRLLPAQLPVKNVG